MQESGTDTKFFLLTEDGVVARECWATDVVNVPLVVDNQKLEMELSWERG